MWPHDNVLFLQGLARYGRTAEVTRLAGALVDALRCEGERFPELFSGVSRSDAPRPVAYPNANVPQAWASGAVLLLVRSLLGLEVDALHARLRFSPSPLRGMRFLRLSNLPIGGARVTIALSWEGAQPRVAIDGLPPSWTWNVE